MPAKWAIIFFKAFVISALIWGFSYWRSLKVPKTISHLQNMDTEPIQTASMTKPFTRSIKGHTYQIEPVYDYELYGLVVSDHHSDAWYDMEHESWNDYLNTKDICVIWGANILNPHLSKINFSHGNWTCYASTKSNEAWQSFNQHQLSNNHIIPASKDIEKLVSNSNVGDEIRIKGHLVNYSVNNGPQRKTSTIRTDKENGACEIIYVTEFTMLASNNKLWIILKSLAQNLSVFFLLMGIFSMFVLPFLTRDNNDESA